MRSIVLASESLSCDKETYRVDKDEHCPENSVPELQYKNSGGDDHKREVQVVCESKTWEGVECTMVLNTQDNQM